MNIWKLSTEMTTSLAVEQGFTSVEYVHSADTIKYSICLLLLLEQVQFYFTR